MAPELVAGGGYGGLIREKPHCATVTFDSRIGRFGGFQDDKKNCRNGPPEHPPAGAGPTEAVKTGLSRTKLLPNGALSDIEPPRRVLTTGAGPIEAHHQDGALPKINCCRNGSDIQLP